MKAKLLKQTDAAPSAGDDPRLETVDGRLVWPAGTVLDGPRAYRLVQLGTAEPADDECREAAGMTDHQMAVAQKHQELVANGIHPDDYEAYLTGEMIGYDETGEKIPGPNYIEDDE